MIKISVIIPVYNVEQYLRRCVDSVLKQSIGDVEIILVNDGSTDKSGDICDEYAANYNNINVVHQKNLGLSIARNVGLDTASGEYISFVDSDDFIEADMYEKMYSIAIEKKCDIVSCGYFLDDDQNSTPKKLAIHADKVISDSELDSMILNANETKVLWFVWKSIYKKELLDKNGIRFNAELRLGEDSPFMIQVLFKSDSLYYIDEPLYHYYQSPDSLTRKKYRPELIEMLNKLHLEKLRLYNEHLPHTDLKQQLDNYTMSHTLPMLIANEINSPMSTVEIAKSYKKIRNIGMIRSAFENYSVKLINSKLKYLAILLKYRLYLPLAVISKRR